MSKKLIDDVLYCLHTGVVYIAVCAPAEWDAERVQTEANAKGRPGTSGNEWIITEGTEEQPTPIACPEDSNRKHWLLNC